MQRNKKDLKTILWKWTHRSYSYAAHTQRHRKETRRATMDFTMVILVKMNDLQVIRVCYDSNNVYMIKLTQALY